MNDAETCRMTVQTNVAVICNEMFQILNKITDRSNFVVNFCDLPFNTLTVQRVLFIHPKTDNNVQHVAIGMMKAVDRSSKNLKFLHWLASTF